MIAGNWKMNQGPEDTAQFFEALATSKPADISRIDAAVCPPFISLPEAKNGNAKLPDIAIGAQNVSSEENGAFTGEVSATMLKELNCDYAITGHSERREYFGETDAQICKKNLKALEHGLTPITCVGEVLDQRKSERHFKVVEEQLTGVMKGFSKEQAEKTVVAYEPVWAIGTGETATPDQAQEMHKFIREILGKMFGDQTAEKIRILYGGSMKPGNAAELIDQPDVDGGLIGGASLKSDSYSELLKIAQEKSG